MDQAVRVPLTDPRNSKGPFKVQEQKSAANVIRDARRIVIKVGSALLTSDSAGARPLSLKNLCADARATFGEGRDLVFVSSGAVALGRAHLPGFGSTLVERQALSAIGQLDLMIEWRAALSQLGLKAAQVLLTPDITEARHRYLTARATLRTLLDAKVVPIINENDTVAAQELRYGDNDRLAAMTGGLIGADLVLLLTDVDGLYTANPQTDPSARHIAFVDAEQLARVDTSDMGAGSAVGTGGMASKVEAARLATSWGVPVVVASGRINNPISCVRDGKARATLFCAAGEAVPARRRWLAGLKPGGRVWVDAGAAAALHQGKSLLSVGVTRVEDDFDEGDVVAVLSPDGSPLGFGLAKAAAAKVTDRSAKLAIHRDDFVLEARP